MASSSKRPQDRNLLKLLTSIDEGHKPTKDELRKLSRVYEADFSNLGITKLPESIGMLSQLWQLDVSKNQLTKLPESIGLLSHLKDLDIYENELTSLPESIVRLSNLRYLSAFGNRLEHLPEGITQLSNLIILSVSYNQLTCLPKSICSLSQLQLLYIGNNPLENIPESIGELSSLYSLDISNLGLVEIPHFIQKLSELQSLDLERNPLRVLPDWLGDMRALRSLSLSFLQLTEFPRSLLKLKIPFHTDYSQYIEEDHHGIYIKGVNLSIQPVSLFDQSRDESPGFQESRKLIEDYFNTPKVPIREAKVIFLGDGKVGKTYTIQRLLHQCKQDEYPTKETHGILIEDLLPEKDGKTYKVRIWDFGGQDIMHEMHRCFLTDRTCYVVMVDTRTDKQTGRARYWLRTVQSVAPEAPVLLLVNEISGGKNLDLDYPSLRMEFSNLVGMEICSSMDAGVEEFRQKVEHAIFERALDMDSCRMELPESWEKVRQELLSQQSSQGQAKAYYIDRKMFHTLCNRYGVPPDDGLRAWLLTWFNDLGVCFSYHLGENGREQSSDYKILDPMWLTSAVYKIIWEKEQTDDGLISQSEIYRILEKPGSDAMKKGGIPCLENVSYSQEECGYVLEIMRKFRISYPADGHTEFMPTLCKPDSKLDPTPEHWVQHAAYQFRYTFLPENVLHRLMIYCYANLRSGKRWRRGFWLECEAQGLSAVIRSTGRDSEENELQIDVYAQTEAYEAWTWLQPLCQQVTKINSDLSLKPKAFILAENDEEKTWFSLDSLWHWKMKGKDTMQGNWSEFSIQSLMDLIYGKDYPEVEQKLLKEYLQLQRAVSLEMFPQAVTAKIAESANVDLRKPFKAQNLRVELGEESLAALRENTLALQDNTLSVQQSRTLLEAFLNGSVSLPPELLEALAKTLQESGKPSLVAAGQELGRRPLKEKAGFLRGLLGDSANLVTIAPVLAKLGQDYGPALLDLIQGIPLP